jgi:hypothetical protein
MGLFAYAIISNEVSNNDKVRLVKPVITRIKVSTGLESEILG